MKKYLVFLITALTFLNCKKKQDEEALIMSCIYNQFDDKGSEFKNALFEYQVYLKSKEFIKDNKGKDIREYLSYLANNKIELQKVDLTFSELLNGISKNDKFDINNCTKLLNSNDSKTKKIQVIISEMVNFSNKSDPINDFLEIVNENDLNNDFYKVFGFMIVDYLILTNETNSKLSRKITDEIKPNSSISTLEIIINDSQKIIIDSEEKSTNEVKKIVFNHIKKYGSEYLIKINTDNKTPYTFYIALQNEIISTLNKLRELKSKEIHDESYSKLSRAKRINIDKMVPINFDESDFIK